MPADRVAALRKAFMDTMKDPEFLAEADKAKLEITPVTGEEVQKIVDDVYRGRPDIAKKAANCCEDWPIPSGRLSCECRTPVLL